MRKDLVRPQLWLALGLLLMTLALPARAVLVVTYRTPESPVDHRYDYDNAVLRLALEKTRKEYGDFLLQASPPMNFSRAIQDARSKTYPNFFIKLSYEDRFADLGLTYARFPIDLGIVGYRVCFVRPELKPRLAATRTLAELKSFSHGQGLGWADAQILTANGFTVQQVSDYENLFKMVAAGRFDLFCRGANELLEEYQAHRSLPRLDFDSSFAIVYPLPRFFYSHSSNRVALTRVTRGLEIAYQDGSLQQLWREKYQASIEFAKLKTRRIFRIDNPLIRKIDFDFRKYDFDPTGR
ncbi:hypothetical protein [Niveibacterium terrae]|uniref:hypothetical protein n=1 Tax=Niveibacterium terrae TaxID=3373598 RepID=UPI003A9511BE